MNPQVNFNNQNIRVPVSVEHVNGYLEMAKTDLGITAPGLLKDIFTGLAEKIHPLTLGEVYRSKTQIQMLAKKTSEKSKPWGRERTKNNKFSMQRIRQS